MTKCTCKQQGRGKAHPYKHHKSKMLPQPTILHPCESNLERCWFLLIQKRLVRECWLKRLQWNMLIYYVQNLLILYSVQKSYIYKLFQFYECFKKCGNTTKQEQLKKIMTNQCTIKMRFKNILKWLFFSWDETIYRSIMLKSRNILKITKSKCGQNNLLKEFSISKQQKVT